MNRLLTLRKLPITLTFFFPNIGANLSSSIKLDDRNVAFTDYLPGACPGWGCPRGPPPPPPPIEIEKQKKGIRANFKLFHLYFATFLVENRTFSSIF